MKMLGRAILDSFDQQIFNNKSNCPKCNEKVEIYNMDMPGYKKAICRNCELESPLDTNITCILGSEIRHKLIWNLKVSKG